MDFKKLLKSKTFWTGIGTIAYGIYNLTQGDNTGVQTILIGLGMIFGRNAIGKLQERR